MFQALVHEAMLAAAAEQLTPALQEIQLVQLAKEEMELLHHIQVHQYPMLVAEVAVHTTGLLLLLEVLVAVEMVVRKTAELFQQFQDHQILAVAAVEEEQLQVLTI